MGYSVYCVFVFFVCTVTDFSASEKDRGVKFRMRVRLLSGHKVSHFGERWSQGVTAVAALVPG